MASRSSRRPPAKPKSQESAGSLARFFLTLVILTWALRSFVVQPFDIPSASMLPTLYIGDYLFTAKWPYGYSRYSFPFAFPSFNGRLVGHLPERGDVVVFHHPAEDADLIKRVIGLPGDTIELRGGRVILNGRPLPERELAPVSVPVTPNSPCKLVLQGSADCRYSATRETLPGGPSFTVLNQMDDGPADNFGPVRVPGGHVFLMGDNRDDSLDSRFPTSVGGVGMVPVDHLIGRALVTFWSTDGSASYFKPWTWFTALRVHRIGNGYTGDAQ
jgi:signal peptidase I